MVGQCGGGVKCRIEGKNLRNKDNTCVRTVFKKPKKENWFTLGGQVNGCCEKKNSTGEGDTVYISFVISREILKT